MASMARGPREIVLAGLEGKDAAVMKWLTGWDVTRYRRLGEGRWAIEWRWLPLGAWEQLQRRFAAVGEDAAWGEKTKVIPGGGEMGDEKKTVGDLANKMGQAVDNSTALAAQLVAMKLNNAMGLEYARAEFETKRQLLESIAEQKVPLLESMKGQRGPMKALIQNQLRRLEEAEAKILGGGLEATAALGYTPQGEEG